MGGHLVHEVRKMLISAHRRGLHVDRQNPGGCPLCQNQQYELKLNTGEKKKNG